MSKSTLNIERVATTSLKPHPKNTRRHPEAQVKLLAKSLERFGWTRPILVDGNDTVIAGHGILEAAKLAGLPDVPILRRGDLSPEQVRAYVIADNKLAEMSVWDDETLVLELGELADPELEDFGLADLGFTGDELRKMLGPPKVATDDPPEEVMAVTKLGDLWVLGKHRLLCGDSTKPEDVTKAMAGEVAQAMFTDPPWNVAIGLDLNPRHRQREGLSNDDLSPEDFRKFLDSFIRGCSKHVSGDVYCVLGASEWPQLDAAFRANGYHWSATIIWVKDLFVLGRSNYHRRYEPLWYGWHGRGKSSFNGERDIDDVWEIPRPRRSDEHPTMKPVELVARALRNSTTGGGLVLDPFGGSGTTLLAAEQEGRRAALIELAPQYCDVILARWQAMTGREPTLDGKTVTEVAKARGRNRDA